jgi:hypothetical protein
MGLSNPVDAGEHAAVKRRKRLALVCFLIVLIVSAAVILPKMF